MPETSAGILLFRRCAEGKERGSIEVLLAHPGGPYWSRKDAGAWTIPKGRIEPGEPPLDAARREFTEETGLAPSGTPIPLRPVKLRSGKTVHAWALEGDCDPDAIRSNTVKVEWPPRSGRYKDVPEIDSAAFFAPAEARTKINPAQAALIDQLLDHLGLPG